MAVVASHLSDPKYNYGFVVSVTQATINSGLSEYFSTVIQPPTYLCFLADSDNLPTIPISLEDLLTKTGQVNPFDIPSGTPASDPRVQTLTAQCFQVGLKIQMGLPPGVDPENLTPIVELGNDAKNVTFNMLCSSLVIIQNTPPGSGFHHGPGRWDVWSQPVGEQWYFKTSVDLKNSDIDQELDTDYFKSFPAKKAQIQERLESITNTTFSLQQLLFDLDSTVMQSPATIAGMPSGSDAKVILESNFVKVYAKSLQTAGEPLLALSARVTSSPDPSQLCMTAFERSVSEYNPGPGASPTPEQLSATTLNYLCMTQGTNTPDAVNFDWNWVQPQDVTSESGVIAVNRNVFAQYLLDNFILPHVQQSCLTTIVDAYADSGLGSWSYKLQVVPDQTPQTAQVTESGANVISIHWESHNDPNTSSSDKDMLFSIKVDVMPNYDCQVSFVDNTIVIEQHLQVYSYVAWDATDSSFYPYDTTITDVYDISVDQNGGLQITLDPNQHKSVDNSTSPDRSAFVNAFTTVDDLGNDIKSDIQAMVPADLSSVSFNGPQAFVFPGANTFTYASANFSTYQDLVCDITFVDPASSPPSSPQPTAEMEMDTLNSVPRLEAVQVSKEEDRAGFITLSPSSEMIQNYVQGETVAPTSKFQALQTADGRSMLFGVDTQNGFNVILEQSGTTRTGWEVTNLSSVLIADSFPANAETAIPYFSVGQSVVDNTIGLAVAISWEGSDHLYLCLSNSSSDTSWIESPAWTPVPFDATESSPTPLTQRIAGIMFAETEDQQQYIIVDIDRAAEGAVKHITRYFVQYPSTSGTSWVKHDVPVDIQSGNYQSCVGRVSNSTVDGVYTMGTAGTSSQLIYAPVVNPFGGVPFPHRLSLPNNAQASAIASARNSDASTDLYAVSGSGLYYFASDSQMEGAVATLLIDNTLFSGTTELSAMTHEGSTTVWGRNASDQVYYVSCPHSQVQNMEAWSVPIPLLSDIERMSSYLNCSDGGNTIFAFGANKLQRLVQASKTTDKLWRTDEIRLVAKAPTLRSQSFNSYTTTIHATDSNNLPVNGALLSITTVSRVSVYIDGLYYILGPTPTTVVTDATGSVTVVEPVDGTISGTVLTVACNNGSTSTIINPMDKTFQSMAQLSDVSSLQQATFPTKTIAGGIKGKPIPSLLVAASTSTTELDVVAASMASLKNAYSSVNPLRSNSSLLTTATTNGTSIHSMPEDPSFAAPSHTLPSFTISSTITHGISIAAGDLYSWLKSGVENSIEIIHDTASATWHFLATVGGKIYHAVLDSVSAVTGAVEWVFNAVKTGIDDIIKFVEFLFEWDDISRTKDVLHNMAWQWISAKAGGIEVAKTAFDDQVSKVEADINKWAGITNWSSSIGSIASQSTSTGSANPSSGQTPGSQMLASHYKNHGGSLTVIGAQPPVDSVKQIIEDLFNALEQSGSALSPLYSGLKSLATDFSSMSLGEVLAKLAAILADETLDGVKAVLDAVFDILSDLSTTALDLLSVKIHIPVISDILNDIGIPDISFLDLFCWIPAVAYTVVYKICNNAPPFPENTEVQELVTADSWESIQTLLVGATQQPSKTASQGPLSNEVSFIAMDVTTSTTFGKLSLDTAKALCTAGNAIAGFMSFFSAFVETCEAEIPEGEDNPWAIPAAVMGMLEAASGAIAETALPKDPIENEALEIMSDAITTGNIISKLIFCGPAQKLLRASNPTGFLVAEDGRATGAVVDVFFAAMAMSITVGHFAEVGAEAANSDRTDAILGELANLSSYVARVSYCVAVNDPDKETMQIALIAMAAAKCLTAGLQTGQAV